MFRTIQCVAFQIGFLHLVLCIQVSSGSFQRLLTYFFLVLNDIPLNVPHFIHSPTEGTSWLLPNFGKDE